MGLDTKCCSVITLDRTGVMHEKVKDGNSGSSQGLHHSHMVACKVILVGSADVGKTSLALRFCRGQPELNPKTTVAADWLHHSITVQDKKINLQIWDTAGQERFLSVVPSFIRGSAGALLVYDVTDVKSFTSKITWLDMVKAEAPNAVIILVANKVDNQHRIISTKDGEIFARDHGLQYEETSAITGYNVEKVFHDLAERIVGSDETPDREDLDKIKLRKDTKPRKKCPC